MKDVRLKTLPVLVTSVFSASAARMCSVFGRCLWGLYRASSTHSATRGHSVETKWDVGGTRVVRECDGSVPRPHPHACHTSQQRHCARSSEAQPPRADEGRVCVGEAWWWRAQVNPERQQDPRQHKAHRRTHDARHHEHACPHTMRRKRVCVCDVIIVCVVVISSAAAPGLIESSKQRGTLHSAHGRHCTWSLRAWGHDQRPSHQGIG